MGRPRTGASLNERYIWWLRSAALQHRGTAALQHRTPSADTPRRMAFADWLLPLLLLAADVHERGGAPFDWAALEPQPAPVSDPALTSAPRRV